MKIDGPTAHADFKNESGGHRFQRESPTEKHGRIHTSTVTVAVLDWKVGATNYQINPKDVEEAFMRGSGKGGQHRNKTSTACRLTHKPTGLQVRVESERSQLQNREQAWRELERRLAESASAVSRGHVDSQRKGQMGSGMRGDKRRTYREKDDIVTDHITGRKASLTRIRAGELDLLWT